MHANDTRWLVQLIVIQAVGSIGVTAAFAVGAIAAERVGGSAGGAATIQALATVFAAGFSVLLARRASVAGRHSSLRLGYGLATLGALLAVWSLEVDSIVLLVAANALLGAAAAASLQARFAAADSAPADAGGRLLSIVVFTSAAGAVLGPLAGLAAGPAVGWAAAPDLEGPYLVAVLAFCVATLCSGGRRAAPRAARGDETRADAAEDPGSMSPRARLATYCSLGVNQGVMVGLMVTMPLSMKAAGMQTSEIGLALSMHLLAMYLPAPVFGWAVDRIGPTRTMLVGAAANVGGCLLLVAMPDDPVMGTGAALFAIGLGWAGVFVAGSAALAAEPPRVQGRADLVINVAPLLAIVTSGWIYDAGDAHALGLVLASAVAMASSAVLATARAQPALS